MNNRQWLWMYARRVKGLLFLTTILLVLEMIANIGIIGIQKFIIDDLFVNQNFDLIVPLLAGLALLAILYNVLHLYAAMVCNKGQFRIQRLLVEDMICYLHRIPVRVFRNQRTGKYVHNLTQDIDQASGMAAVQIPNGVMEISGALILSVIIGYASPILLMILLGVSIVYIVLGTYFAPRMKKSAKDAAEKRTELLVMIEEGIASTREVVAFHRQDWEKSRFGDKFYTYFTKVMQQVKLNNQQALYSMPIQWGIRLIVLGYGGYMVIQGNLSIGLFVVIFQFSSQLLTSYERVYNFFVGLSGHMAAVERVREVMDGEKDNEGTEMTNTNIKSLSMHNVGFQYESESAQVLQGVNIHIPIGKKIAFVGTSGGGKSTIAQLLIRFYEPSTGIIRVNDEPLSNICRDDWHKRLSIVFQQPFLFPDTIRNNLIMGRMISEDHMIEICNRMQIHEFIISLQEGYDTQVGERGIQLSGGQRQRIALARALLANCEILILDEATSALDLETERQVQRNLDEYRKNLTTIVIAHRLSTIMDADVIYVMDAGQVSEQGTHQELLAKGRIYPNLVHMQNDTAVKVNI